MSLPYFPMFPADFEADTSHLTLEEDGAFNRLLRICWLTPGCSLPEDPVWLARRLRVDPATYQRVVAPIIAEFFKVHRGRIYSPRLVEIYGETSEKHKRRVEAGRKGGRPRKSLEDKALDESNAKALPKQPEPEPEPEELRESPSETPASLPPDLDAPIEDLDAPPADEVPQEVEEIPAMVEEARARVPKLPEGFAAFWDAYPPRRNKKAEKQKAIEQYKRALAKGMSPDALLDAALTLRASVEAGGDYPSDAFRWLRDEKWTDEITIPTKPQGDRRHGRQTATNAFLDFADHIDAARSLAPRRPGMDLAEDRAPARPLLARGH